MEGFMNLLNKKIALFFVLVLITSTLLFGCDIGSNYKYAEDFTGEFLDLIIDDNYSDSYGMFSEICTEEQYKPLYNEIKKVFANTKEYKLTFANINMSIDNGRRVNRVTYLIESDDQKTAAIELYFSNEKTILGAYFADRTDFVESSKSLSVINFFLIILTVACTAFSIWMFVDCIRHKMKMKWLWAILILIGFGLSITKGESNFAVNFHFVVGFMNSTIISNSVYAMRTFRFMLPVGAIIYCALRKRIFEKPQEVAAIQEQADQPKEEQAQ